MRTVESHVASLLRKLDAADRRELADLAAVTRSSATPPDLPAPWTTFIGRELERAEALGALGRREGIACLAVALLMPR